MFLVTLKEKMAIVVGGETFYGKVLVASGQTEDEVGLVVNGFLSIVGDSAQYNTFKGGLTVDVAPTPSEVIGVQRNVDMTGVPTA